MALTLTIGGDNYLPQYKTNSARINEVLQHRGNTLSLELVKKPSQSAPQEGKEIIFKDGTRFLFAGYVTKIDPIEIGEGQLFVYRIEAMDYSYILGNKSAQRGYTNQTLKYIVEDLLDEWVDPGYGLTTTEVQTGPVIDTVLFDHVDLRTAFEKLAKLSGYEFWISYDKVVNFKPKDYDSAPESITDSSNNFESINIKYDTSQVRNSIVVKGGREETSAYFQQTIVCDGVAREWLLREKPKTLEYIKLNTVTQTVGVDPLDNDTEASYDFLFNFQEKFIRCSSAQATPALGDEIEVSYKYEVPIITLLSNATSIATMKAIEGGDGVHAFTIVNEQIKSKAEARKRALKELAEYANPLVNGIFVTTSLMLGAGSIFSPGQALAVNLPSWGISVDKRYLIQAVSIQIFQDGTDIFYKYTVRFGGRVLDTLAFLESLATKEEPGLISELDTIKGITEIITVTETIERDPNLKTLTETVTISEDLGKTNFTPPFKWGGPLVRFLFNEGASYGGSTANDDSEYNNDGTVSGGTFIDSGYQNGGYRQTGSTNKVMLAIPLTLTGAFTFVAWIKPSNLAINAGLMSSEDLYAEGRISFYSNYTQIRFDNSGAVNMTFTASWTVNTWQHVIITRNASNVLKIYRNNVDITNGSYTLAGNFLIEKILDNSNDSSYTAFIGDADNVIIYNYEISSQERAALYALAPQAKWNKAEWS
jgi:hypothetical protein